MNPLNLATASSPPPVANDLLAKRKRGRPRKDETLTHQPQQGNSQVTPKPDVNLVGKMVSGVVEGSFDAGYILNVKVKDSDIKLRGLVFMPGKVTPVTPENDVAPHVKMVAKEEIKDQTDDHDQTMKDAVTDLEIFESAARALSLAPHQSNAEEEPKEVMEEREAATTTTRLVEFFPTPETTMVTAHQQNLVLPQKETVEKLKSPGEPRGFDLMAEEPVGVVEKVPQELKLELGNKMIMSGDKKNGNTMETDPKTSVSKSGFIANLFEGEDKNADSAMEEEATPSVQ